MCAATINTTTTTIKYNDNNDVYGGDVPNTYTCSLFSFTHAKFAPQSNKQNFANSTLSLLLLSVSLCFVSHSISDFNSYSFTLRDLFVLLFCIKKLSENTKCGIQQIHHTHNIWYVGIYPPANQQRKLQWFLQLKALARQSKAKHRVFFLIQHTHKGKRKC